MVAQVTCALLLLLWATPKGAFCFPGVLVGKDDARRTVRTSHVALLVAEGLSVVTVAADYQGPLGPMAWLMPVPPEAPSMVSRSILARLLHLRAMASSRRL